MISQARLKVLRSLQLKKARSETARFLVQGKKVVAELLHSQWSVDELVATQEAADWVKALAEKRRVPVHVLPQAELDRIGTFEKGNELIAITVDPGEVPYRAPKANELILALDGVRDPRNMGSLIRIADWFGLERIVCSADCMEVFNPKVVSSTMGSLFHLDVRQGVDLAAELTRMSEGGAKVYIADMDGTPAYTADVKLPAVLVLGSESHGHSAAIASMQAEVISIPRVGKAESLNVAMAAAALCMEITRQTHPAGPRR